MSTSSAQTTSSTEAPEPLRSLLAQIDTARALPELEPHEPADGDPLERLRRTIRGEGDPAQSTEPESSAAAPASSAPSAAASRTGLSTGHSTGGEAVVGRVVVDMLRTRPLDGEVRAEAVERLAAQLEQPDPDALREILALLVTGQRV